MWLLLLLFILYVATLISFGYFRYAYQNSAKGCHTTWQCFSTHFDGLRSGGISGNSARAGTGNASRFHRAHQAFPAGMKRRDEVAEAQ